MAFSRAAAMSSLAWIALSMAAISRTLVEGTWLKMLRYQCTIHLCQAASGCGALGKPDRGIGGHRPDTLHPAFLEMLEERAPASLVLLRPLANAENLPVAALIHADRNQQRDVAYLAGPAALEHDAVKINIRVLA